MNVGALLVALAGTDRKLGGWPETMEAPPNQSDDVSQHRFTWRAEDVEKTTGGTQFGGFSHKDPMLLSALASSKKIERPRYLAETATCGQVESRSRTACRAQCFTSERASKSARMRIWGCTPFESAVHDGRYRD